MQLFCSVASHSFRLLVRQRLISNWNALCVNLDLSGAGVNHVLCTAGGEVTCCCVPPPRLAPHTSHHAKMHTQHLAQKEIKRNGCRLPGVRHGDRRTCNAWCPTLKTPLACLRPKCCCTSPHKFPQRPTTLHTGPKASANRQTPVTPVEASDPD